MGHYNGSDILMDHPEMLKDLTFTLKILLFLLQVFVPEVQVLALFQAHLTREKKIIL